jgi:hypothetical protein
MQEIAKRVVEDRLKTPYVLQREVRVESGPALPMKVMVFGCDHGTRSLETSVHGPVSLTALLR